MRIKGPNLYIWRGIIRQSNTPSWKDMTTWLKTGRMMRKHAPLLLVYVYFWTLWKMQTTFPIFNSLILDRKLLSFTTFTALFTSHSSCQMSERTKSSCLEEGIKVTGIILLFYFLTFIFYCFHIFLSKIYFP